MLKQKSLLTLISALKHIFFLFIHSKCAFESNYNIKNKYICATVA